MLQIASLRRSFGIGRFLLLLLVLVLCARSASAQYSPEFFTYILEVFGAAPMTVSGPTANVQIDGLIFNFQDTGTNANDTYDQSWSGTITCGNIIALCPSFKVTAWSSGVFTAGSDTLQVRFEKANSMPSNPLFGDTSATVQEGSFKQSVSTPYTVAETETGSSPMVTVNLPGGPGSASIEFEVTNSTLLQGQTITLPPGSSGSVDLVLRRSPPTVPEPATMLLLGTGLVASVLRRKLRQA